MYMEPFITFYLNIHFAAIRNFPICSHTVPNATCRITKCLYYLDDETALMNRNMARILMNVVP
jgi:hypothetical protein